MGMYSFMYKRCYLFRIIGNMKRLCIGDAYEDRVTFSQEDVILFSQITGDTNPIHIDQEFASKSVFGRLVVHGMYAGCSFSRVLGTIFPGKGSINLYREFTFIRPVFVNEEYTMFFKIVGIDTSNHIGTLKCRLKNKEGKICIDCLTRLKNEERF